MENWCNTLFLKSICCGSSPPWHTITVPAALLLLSLAFLDTLLRDMLKVSETVFP
ncbi:MAG: hypothetical protein LBP88_06580 [Treponema sp.]|nr:hypothetical protein [Treponema sp.]